MRISPKPHPVSPSRVSRADLAVLQLLADGRILLPVQVTGWRALERRALIRIEFGKPGTADHDKLCCYLTERGRTALAHAKG
jgi:hypothetical protein